MQMRKKRINVSQSLSREVEENGSQLLDGNVPHSIPQEQNDKVACFPELDKQKL